MGRTHLERRDGGKYERKGGSKKRGGGGKTKITPGGLQEEKEVGRSQGVLRNQGMSKEKEESGGTSLGI